MKYQKFAALLFFVLIFSFSAQAQINALALKSGCKIISAPVSYGQSSKSSITDWSQEAIIDESAERGWCSGSANVYPMTFLFELSEEYNLEKMGFNNFCQKDYQGICAKEIKIESSSIDAYSGFKEVGLIKLDEYAKKYYPVKTKARWIKVTILSNYGNASYTELMDIEALGKPVVAGTVDLTGQYNTSYGSACFKKNKNGYLYGCYESGSGEISDVTIDNKIISYRWLERSTGMKGWAIITANKDGSRLSGLWGYNEDHTNPGIWEWEKVSGYTRACSNDDAMQNSVTSVAMNNEKKTYLTPEETTPVKVETRQTIQPVVENKGDTKVQQTQPVISSSDVDFDPAASGKNYLFIVAINEYKFWNKLSNAKKDARDVKEILTTRYKFDKENVYEIYDEEATAAAIFAKITELKKHITGNDNLLIYFSGHGYYNADIEEGFWIPVDAKRGVETEYMPNSTLLKYVKSIPAKHIFLVADACFSGALLSQTSRGYVENVEQYKSRWALTSGRLEFVSDGDAGVNSPFASYFIKFLRENKKAKVPVTELIQYVKVSVSNNSEQTPMGSPLKNVGDEGGEFVFYLK